MQARNAFLVKFASSIIAVLGCHDRVIFKGHLPFSDEHHLNRFVDHTLRIKRKDFLAFAADKSELLVTSAKDFAAQHGAPYVYLQGRHRKEDLIRQQIRERRLSEGLVCVLGCQETCRTVKLRYGDGRPRLVFTCRPQRVLYFYFLDPQFGLRHVRVQTWFPFTTQVYLNGHDWLARQLHDAGSGFVQHDNAFTQLDDPARRKPWPTASRASLGSRSWTAGPARSTRCSASPGSEVRAITGSSTRPNTAPTSSSKTGRP